MGGSEDGDSESKTAVVAGASGELTVGNWVDGYIEGDSNSETLGVIDGSSEFAEGG